MGMVDYVKCDYPLAKQENQDLLFRTKDFSACPNGDYLRITEDGELWVMKHRDVHRAHRPPYKTSWTGELMFSACVDKAGVACRVEYVAMFGDGLLRGLRASEYVDHP